MLVLLECKESFLINPEARVHGVWYYRSELLLLHELASTWG